MEAIDNKYLIVVTAEGKIEVIKTKVEQNFNVQNKIFELLSIGCSVILNGQYEETDLIHLIDPTYMFFPSIFKSFEQVSISIELFNYYVNKKLNVWHIFFDEETRKLNYSIIEATRTQLEDEKNRLEQIYEQEYISRKALRLIYPDGKIESVNETLNIELGDKYHLYYYTKLYNKSPKLRTLLTNFIPYSEEKDDVEHNEIDNELVNKQVAILLNQYVGVELSERTHSLAEFRILLPKNYGNITQMEKIEEILKNYPEHRMSLGKWNDELKRCTSTYVTDVLEDIALKKELIRKEGK